MDFDWGILSQEFIQTLRREIVKENSYLKFFPVEKGDIVFDVGASVGIFSFSILPFGPGEIHCFEPHESLFETLRKNMEGKAVLINAGIAEHSGEGILNGVYNPDSMNMWSMPVNAKTVDIKSYVERNLPQGVDFLKLDCEGCEYDVFSPNSEDWAKSKVRKVAGEWHLHNDELKQKFTIFRDGFLRALPPENYWVESMDGVDIKQYLFDDWFIPNYSCIMVYMLMPRIEK